MKERAAGVRRLLRALHSASGDDYVIKVLAHQLNYVESQLKEDISCIPEITISDKKHEGPDIP